MMRIEWTNDYDLVLSTIRHPSVYGFVSDDTCPPANNFFIPKFGKNFFSAACYRDENYCGCFCFFRKSNIEAEIHTCMLSHAKGMAKSFGDLVVKLFFATKKYSILSTFIPENNILAKKLALKCGFLYESEDKPIIMNGIKIPTHKYTLKRGDVCL